MINYKKCSLLCWLVFITSCECIQHIQGIVVDAESRLPIEGVLVKRNDISFDSVSRISPDETIMPNNSFGIDWDGGSHGKYTDSLGLFEFTYMASALFGYPKISLTFEKDGYIEFKKRYKGYNEDTVIVVLKKNTQ